MGSQILSYLQFTTVPRGTIHIGGPREYLHLQAGAADIKVGHALSYKSGGLTNDCDRADTAALLKTIAAVADIPTKPVDGTVADPMAGYTFSDNELIPALLLVPGLIFYARCKDSSNNINWGDTCVFEATNVGVEKMSDTLAIGTTTTGLEFKQSFTGENIPLTWKLMALHYRASSSTESWLPVMVLGR